jgi:hypothetical protein
MVSEEPSVPGTGLTGPLGPSQDACLLYQDERLARIIRYCLQTVYLRPSTALPILHYPPPILLLPTITMRLPMTFILPYLFLPFLRAAPTNTTSSVVPNCHDIMLSLPVTGTNYDLGIKPVTNDAEAVAWTLDIDRWSAPNVTERIQGEVHINQTVEIYAQLCFPAPAKDRGIVQILSHGGIFDHRYCMLNGMKCCSPGPRRSSPLLTR